MKIPVIYHTLKPLVDIGIDKFNTSDGKEMDHETTTIFFSDQPQLNSVTRTTFGEILLGPSIQATIDDTITFRTCCRHLFSCDITLKNQDDDDDKDI